MLIVLLWGQTEVYLTRRTARSAEEGRRNSGTTVVCVCSRVHFGWNELALGLYGITAQKEAYCRVLILLWGTTMSCWVFDELGCCLEPMPWTGCHGLIAGTLAAVDGYWRVCDCSMCECLCSTNSSAQFKRLTSDLCNTNQALQEILHWGSRVTSYKAK